MSQRLTRNQRTMVRDFAARTAASSAAIVRAAIDEAVPVMAALIETGAIAPPPALRRSSKPRKAKKAKTKKTKKTKAKTRSSKPKRRRTKRDRQGRFQGSFGF